MDILSQSHIETPSAEWPGETPKQIKFAGLVSEIVSDLAVDESDPDFDWTSDDSVIIQEQLCVAVYRNKAGAVVLRQERNGYTDEDMFICLRDAEAIRVVISALQRELRAGAK